MGNERRHTYLVDGGICWKVRIGRWLLRAAVWCHGEGRTKGQNLRQPTCVSSRVPVPVVLARPDSVRHNQQAHQRRSRHPPRNTSPEGSRGRSARWRPHRAGTPQARWTGYRDHATACAGFQSTCCSKRSRSLAQHWQYPSPNPSCPLLCRAGIVPTVLLPKDNRWQRPLGTDRRGIDTVVPASPPRGAFRAIGHSLRAVKAR